MDFILKLVSFDVLSLLKGQDGNSDVTESHHKLLIRLRNVLRKLYTSVSIDGWRSLTRQSVRLFDLGDEEPRSRSRSRTVSDESLQAIIYDSSCYARKMISYAGKGYYHKHNTTAIVDDEKINDLNVVIKSDLVFSYLDWYTNTLEEIVRDGIDISAFNQLNETLNIFKDEIEKFERDIIYDTVLVSIEGSIDNFTSKAKSDAQAFIDRSLSAAASEISGNTKRANMALAEFDSRNEDFKNILEKQAQYFQDIETVYEYCNTRKSSIDAIFIAANRQGMAKSFEIMASGLVTPMKIWGAILILSLISIVIAGFVIEANVINENINENLLATISLRALIVSPLIWLAWFSGRQFGHSSKLRQDYSYKSAIAMAYQGYKDESTALSSDMHSKLLENIIIHFSDNPVRLYEKSDLSSPIDEVLKKISPEKLSEIIKSIKN